MEEKYQEILKESVRETGNEDDKASDQGREKDGTSQEKEKEQYFEIHSNTGMCNCNGNCMTSAHYVLVKVKYSTAIIGCLHEL